MQFEVEKPEELLDTAQLILSQFPACHFFILKGEMGAGKTALTKAFVQVLESEDEAKSPTFSIINEYIRKDGGSIFHFDFYRIKEETEAMDIGIEEYFYSDNYCFVEWPEKIPNLLPENYVEVVIQLSKHKIRHIKVSEIR